MAQLIPVNFTESRVAATLGDAATQPPPAPPPVEQIADWYQENYTLDISAAANLGFPVGNITPSARHHVLLFGVSRATDISDADGHVYRFGVSLRALVVVTDVKMEGGLTLPVIAAKVELEGARASAQLLVRGYRGDLGPMLPQWQSFGVDSYADYTRAVSEIQTKIFSDPANMVPELLATTVSSSELPVPAASIGMVYALDAIAKGVSLVQALDKLEADDRQTRNTVRAVFLARVGEDERARPDDGIREAALTDLQGLHLTHGLFERL
jgi:hypothetical protein